MVQKVLLIQLRQLGDIILTTPCAREIKKEYPNCEVSFLCHKLGLMVLKNNPYIDSLYYYENNMPFLKYLKLLKELRKQKFDIVIDFMNDPRSAIFTFVTGATTRASRQSARFWAYNLRLNMEKHKNDYIVDEKFTLLKQCGFSPKHQHLDVFYTQKDLKPSYDFFHDLEHAGFKPSKNLKVILSPTHRRANRKWSPLKYAMLADRLVSEWQAIVTWIWGPNEESEVDEIVKLCKQKTFKIDKMSFLELAAFIKNNDLFIGNSNGPSHLAVAGNIHSLQLHGHTNASSWCPQNNKHRALQSSEFGTEKNPTLNSISLDDTWKELKKMKTSIFQNISSKIE